MPSQAELDAITLEQLHATGATKWNRLNVEIGAFTAEMDYGVAPEITAALHAAVDQGLFAYLPLGHKTSMQAAVSSYVAAKTKWQVRPENVNELADVIAAFTSAIQYFSAPGSKIIVPTPAYMPFLSVPASLGREVIEVPLIQSDHGYVMDLAAIEQAFADGGGLLVLCNPHNPTGRVYTREELQAVEALVDRVGGRVFSDEIWFPLVYSGHEHIPYASIGQAAASHTVTATAASKAFNLPGLKCAQLITSNSADQEHWEEVGILAMHGAANLGLVATSAAFTEADAWLCDILEYLEGNRDLLESFLRENLPQVKFTHSEGTYITWLDLREYEIDGPLQQFFIDQAGVMLTEGTACGKVGAGHVRFVFAMPRPIMLKALQRMATALGRRGA